MLHADADFSVAVESSVESHNVGGVTLVKHLQLSNDLVPDGWLDLQVDQLQHSRKQVSCMLLHHKDSILLLDFCVHMYTNIIKYMAWS